MDIRETPEILENPTRSRNRLRCQGAIRRYDFLVFNFLLDECLTCLKLFTISNEGDLRLSEALYDLLQLVTDFIGHLNSEKARLHPV